MRLNAVLAAALLALAACRSGNEPPDAAYRRLSAAVRARDADAAWPLLSSATQAWLDARAKAAAARAPGVVPASGKELFLGSAAAAVRAPKSIVVVRESKERAVLLVSEEAGGNVEVTLVHDGGRWRLELPDPGAGAR